MSKDLMCGHVYGQGFKLSLLIGMLVVSLLILQSVFYMDQLRDSMEEQ